jgi:hypothetical protein
MVNGESDGGLNIGWMEGWREVKTVSKLGFWYIIIQYITGSNRL